MRYLLLLLLPLTLFGQISDNNARNTHAFPAATTIDDTWPWGATATAAPAAPILEIQNQEDGIVFFRWTESVAGDLPVSHYILNFSAVTPANGYTTMVPTADSFVYYAQELRASGTRYANVRAVDTAGNTSPVSNEVSLTAVAHTNNATNLGQALVLYIPDEVGLGSVIDDAVAGTPDLSTGVPGYQPPWYPPFNREYVDVQDPLPAGDLFDQVGWTFATGPYLTIAGGTATFNNNGRTDTSDLAITGMRDNIDYLLRINMPTWTNGNVRVEMAGNTNMAYLSAPGTYDVLVNGNTTNTIRLTFNNAIGTMSSLEAYPLRNGWGDYWQLSNVASNYLVDTDKVGWGAMTDWAVEARISAEDWSTGATQSLIGTFGGGPDRELLIQAQGGGTWRAFYSENGSAFAWFDMSTDVYALAGIRDGHEYFYWFRFEFDYLNSTGSRMRYGISKDRNGFHPWEWSAWTSDTASSIDIYEGSEDTYIGSENGTSARWADGGIAEIHVYDGLTATTNPVYTFDASTHNHSGNATVTNTQGASLGSMAEHLITRPSVQSASTVDFGVTYTAGKTDLADATYASITRRTALQDVNSSPIFQTDGTNAVFLRDDASAGSASYEIEMTDGTTTTTSATASAYTLNQVYGMAFTAETGTPGAARADFSDGLTDLTLSGNLTALPASGTLTLGGQNSMFYGGAVFDNSVLGAPDGDDVKQMFGHATFGRWGNGDAATTSAGADLGGAGAADGGVLTNSGTPNAQAFDTFRFTAYNLNAGGLNKTMNIEEISLYESVDGTGTNVALMADIDDDTRDPYPYATGSFLSASDQTALLAGDSPVYFAVDANAATSWESSTTDPEGTNVGSIDPSITIHLESPVVIRSVALTYDNSTQIPSGTYLLAWNRDDPDNGLRYQWQTDGIGTTTRAVARLQY